MIDTLGAVKEEEVVAVVEKMSASEANNLFTALRKAANHPLLLRVHYKDAAVLDKIAKTAYNQEHFGNQCDLQRVRAEIELLSDFDLHCLCLEYPLSLKGLELDSTALYDSPKMELLQSMLPQLQVCVSFEPINDHIISSQ
jgi:SWI/SNF-related matrix-associated actin-dependent regulator 1 of chromatin subfamily A